MRRSPMPARVTPLPCGDGLQRTADVTILRGGGKVVPFPAPKRPKDTIPASVRRIVTERDMGLCVHCGQPAVHIHHRRIKGLGGDTRAHSDCPCALVSVCLEGHELAHHDRFLALAEGLIVPRATPLPGLLPVLVHGYEDGSGVRAWPTCDGEWLTYEPDGGSAA